MIRGHFEESDWDRASEDLIDVLCSPNPERLGFEQNLDRMSQLNAIPTNERTRLEAQELNQLNRWFSEFQSDAAQTWPQYATHLSAEEQEALNDWNAVYTED